MASIIKQFLSRTSASEDKDIRRLHPAREDEHERIPIFTLFFVYWQFAVVQLVIMIREWFLRAFLRDQLDNPRERPDGYAPLFSDFDSYWTRNYYGRIKDCFNRPICSAPGGFVDLLERDMEGGTLNRSLEFTGKRQRCMNLSSYNYLGFAENHGQCTEAVVSSVQSYGVSPCSALVSLGYTDVHRRFERQVARYLGREASIVFGMGYATNSTCIASLVGPDGLLISDKLNHASLVVGCRCAGAHIRVFQHNNLDHLEHVLRKAIVEGHPRTRRPWSKIIILVEGIYSMEGEIIDLPAFVAIKKKYKAYLYLDEAHSIGALGPTGRGVCELTGVDPRDVDVLMGTFTKSFGSAGGYICGDQELIDYLRVTSFSSLYDTAIPVGTVAQASTAMHVISGDDGTDEGRRRLQALSRNTRYFRSRLTELGYRIAGADDSPVVPMMFYHSGKMPLFSRMALELGLAVVVVSYPATQLLLCRVRFCMTSGHTIEQLEEAVAKIHHIGQILSMQYNKPLTETWRNYLLPRGLYPPPIGKKLGWVFESFSQ